MTVYLIQVLTGLSHAATLFLVASGLSIIFGVTRIVNFAHGSFYMLGAYCAYSFSQFLMVRLGAPFGFWAGIVLAALIVGRRGCADGGYCCCGASTVRPSCSSCWPPSAWCWWCRTRRSRSGVARTC